MEEYCLAMCTNARCSRHRIYAPKNHRKFEALNKTWDICIVANAIKEVNIERNRTAPLMDLVNEALPGIGHCYSFAQAEPFNLIMFEVACRLGELKNLELSQRDKYKFERIMVHLNLRLDNLPWHNSSTV